MKRPERPNIIDIEASGFGPHSYPIEVGLALESGERYSCLITPEPDWTHWSDQAQSVHGIERRHLIEYGKPATEVATILNQRLSGLTLYSDGWVVDKPWLVTLFAAARITPQFTLSALEMILSEPQMEAWRSVRTEVANELDLKRHRASQDAWVIQETYRRSQALTTTPAGKSQRTA